MTLETEYKFTAPYDIPQDYILICYFPVNIAICSILEDRLNIDTIDKLLEGIPTYTNLQKLSNEQPNSAAVALSVRITEVH